MRVHRVLAPNPSLMTAGGTNSWVLEVHGHALVVDPGPLHDGHLAEIRGRLDGLEPVGVAVTHGHPDHAPAANRLARELGVPAIGSGAAPGFAPDRLVADGDVVQVASLAVGVIATPGHTADHVCYRAEDVLFAGDHIMGGSTVIVQHMGDYLASLRRLLGTGLHIIHPGHGEIVRDPDGEIDRYLAHRAERERQIVKAVRGGASTVAAIVEVVYVDVNSALHPMAALSVAAHLRKLGDDGVVELASGATDWGSPVVLAAGSL